MKIALNGISWYDYPDSLIARGSFNYGSGR
jgi:hypothetical protein